MEVFTKPAANIITVPRIIAAAIWIGFDSVVDIVEVVVIALFCMVVSPFLLKQILFFCVALQKTSFISDAN